MTNMIDRKGLVETMNEIAGRLHNIAMQQSNPLKNEIRTCGDDIRDALAQQDTQQDGREAVAWRWVDDKGRAMTEWATDKEPPPEFLREVSDEKGTMRVQFASTTPPPSPELAVFKALVLDAIPSNWLDPLLSGPTKFADPPYSCHDIEALLRGIRERITAAIAAVEGARK